MKHKSLASIVKDDLKAVGGGLVGLNLAAMDAAITVAAWPTVLRKHLEKDLCDEVIDQPYKPTIFSQSVSGVYLAAAPLLRVLASVGVASELADGKIDNWPMYFYIVPMGISALYEGIRYVKNKSMPLSGNSTA